MPIFFFNIRIYTELYSIDQFQIFFGTVLFLCFLLYSLSFENPEELIRQRDLSDDVVSIYECGFEPFEEPQELLFIQYFPIAILFLLFDLELVYLLPWALAPSFSVASNAWIAFLFFFAIGLGLFLEWQANTLNWLKINNIRATILYKNKTIKKQILCSFLDNVSCCCYVFSSWFVSPQCFWHCVSHIVL